MNIRIICSLWCAHTNNFINIFFTFSLFFCFLFCFFAYFLLLSQKPESFAAATLHHTHSVHQIDSWELLKQINMNAMNSDNDSLCCWRCHRQVLQHNEWQWFGYFFFSFLLFDFILLYFHVAHTSLFLRCFHGPIVTLLGYKCFVINLS